MAVDRFGGWLELESQTLVSIALALGQALRSLGGHRQALGPMQADLARGAVLAPAGLLGVHGPVRRGLLRRLGAGAVPCRRRRARRGSRPNSSRSPQGGGPLPACCELGGLGLGRQIGRGAARRARRGLGVERSPRGSLSCWPGSSRSRNLESARQVADRPLACCELGGGPGSQGELWNCLLSSPCHQVSRGAHRARHGLAAGPRRRVISLLARHAVESVLESAARRPTACRQPAASWAAEGRWASRGVTCRARRGLGAGARRGLGAGANRIGRLMDESGLGVQNEASDRLPAGCELRGL